MASDSIFHVHLQRRAAQFTRSLSPSTRNELRMILRELGGREELLWALEKQLLTVDTFLQQAEKIVSACMQE